MVPAGRGLPRFDRLDVRLVILLGIALLPIGLIAITQTLRMMSEVEARASSALLGETIEAAGQERSALMNALGATRALASVGPALLQNREECAEVFETVHRRLESVVFAGLVLPDGTTACATANGDGATLDSALPALFDDQGESVAVVNHPALPSLGALMIRQPIMNDGEVLAVVLIATSLDTLSGESRTFGGIRPREIVLFSDAGEVLGARSGLEERLPRDMPLAELSGTEDLFRDTDSTGVSHVYTVAPILPGQLNVLASWDPTILGVDRRSVAGAVTFPMLMWFASLAVAYFAVHALVIRHIRNLRQRIRIFASSRRLIDGEPAADMPIELREVVDAFRSMTVQILGDEADLENSLHEKDVLLKEVHHRVKNNLQLIASMTNMQIRKTDDPRTRSILRRLQDRVLGMAAVHRSLYETNSLSEVRADQILREVANQLIRNAVPPGAGIGFEARIDPVRLYPDQALPLSLLVSEALTNAVKYIGRPRDGAPPQIGLTLSAPPGEKVVLTIENTLGDPVPQIENVEGSGLGSQLIAAFVMQLGAESRTEATEDRYRLFVQFERSEFSELAPDGDASEIQPRPPQDNIKAAG